MEAYETGETQHELSFWKSDRRKQRRRWDKLI